MFLPAWLVIWLNAIFEQLKNFGIPLPVIQAFLAGLAAGILLCFKAK